MNKKLQALTTRQALSDFTGKLSAKWRLRIQPNIPSDDDTPISTADILSDLVAIPTITGNSAANHEALDYITHFVSSRGMHVQRMEWNGVESLVATTRKTKTPIVYLAGHIDVVPAPTALFELREQNGNYYGRGVLDMKGGIAAFLGAIQRLQSELGNYDFGIMIMTDEEAGGFDGAARLAKAGYLSKVMIIPDGGSNWNPERLAKGIWHVTFDSLGKSAHGSRPWEGQNAIDNLMGALTEIKKLFPEKMDMETSTINIGIIQGGEAINQIPTSASASLDMRFGSHGEQQRITAAINAVIEKYHLKLVTEVTADPMVSDPSDPYLHAYEACAEAVVGKKLEWITSGAGNDGRFFAPHGVRCAIAYPEGGNHHGLEEHITTDSLLQMEEIYVRYIQKIARDA